MKGFIGFLIILILLLTLIELIRATYLFLIFGSMIFCLVGLIYGITTNIIWRLKERKTNNNEDTEFVKKFDSLQQVKKYESGELAGSWKDEKIGKSYRPKRSSIYEIIQK